MRSFLVWCGLLSSWGAWAGEHTHSVVAARGFSCLAAGGILGPSPGTEPMSPALEGRFLITRPPGILQRDISWIQDPSFHGFMVLEVETLYPLDWSSMKMWSIKTYLTSLCTQQVQCSGHRKLLPWLPGTTCDVWWPPLVLDVTLCSCILRLVWYFPGF